MISKLSKMSFFVGKHYQDEVTCDVVNMKACHLLLGRPWKFDVRAIHKGRENVYDFYWKGK